MQMFLLLRYRNATFIHCPLSFLSIESNRQVTDTTCQVKLRAADYAPDIALRHRTLPSAGYQRDTPLAVNRWHGSPVGLSSTCWVLDRAAPFARRCRRNDDDFPFLKYSPSIHARASSSTIFANLRIPIFLVEELRYIRYRKKGPSKRGPSPSSWRNTTLRTGRRRREGKEGRKAGKLTGRSRFPRIPEPPSPDCMQITRGNIFA